MGSNKKYEKEEETEMKEDSKKMGKDEEQKGIDTRIRIIRKKHQTVVKN